MGLLKAVDALTSSLLSTASQHDLDNPPQQQHHASNQLKHSHELQAQGVLNYPSALVVQVSSPARPPLHNHPPRLHSHCMISSYESLSDLMSHSTPPPICWAHPHALATPINWGGVWVCVGVKKRRGWVGGGVRVGEVCKACEVEGT